MWSFTLTLYRTGPVCSMAVLVRDKRLQGAVGWAGTISCWPTSLYPAYSDPTLSWHFNPEGAVLGWRRWFFVEDRIKLVLQSSSSLLSCYSFLGTLHQFFRITIGCMGGRCTHNMLNTISSCKFPKCFWRELWSVVRSHMLRESQVGKQGAQCANTLLSSSVLHHKDLRSLAVCLKSPPLASFLDLDQWSLCKAFAREGREISTGGEMNGLDYLLSPDIPHNNLGSSSLYPCRGLATKHSPATSLSSGPYLCVPHWVFPDLIRLAQGKTAIPISLLKLSPVGQG